MANPVRASNKIYDYKIENGPSASAETTCVVWKHESSNDCKYSIRVSEEVPCGIPAIFFLFFGILGHGIARSFISSSFQDVNVHYIH